VQITVNGTAKQATEGLPLTQLVAQVSDRSTGIAVAVNGEVVPRSRWLATVLADGDRVDVVTAVQGG
jgi:sulfur carrier protein